MKEKKGKAPTLIVNLSACYRRGLFQLADYSSLREAKAEIWRQI